jgi:hypothetical protein
MLLLINLNKILYTVIDTHILLSTSARSTSIVNLLPFGVNIHMKMTQKKTYCLDSAP